MNKSKPIWIIFGVIALAPFLYKDYSLLFQTDVMTGVDGYYYVVQLDSLRVNGRLYYHTNTPFTLYFLAGLNFVIGNSVIAIKAGALLIEVALCFGVAFVLFNLTRNFWITMIGPALILISALHLYFLSDFLNSFGALAFFVWAFGGFIKAIQTRRKRWILFTILLLLASCLSHRSSIWLLLCLSLVGGIVRIWSHYTDDGIQKLTFLLILSVGLLISLVAAYIPSSTIPEIFSDELLGKPRNPYRLLTLTESLTLTTIATAGIILLFTRPQNLKTKLSGQVFSVVVIWSILFTLNPFLNHDTGFSGLVGRLDTLAFLQVAIGVPLLASLYQHQSFPKRGALEVIALILLLLGRWHGELPVGFQKDYLNHREVLSREIPSIKSQIICEDPLIVASHGNQFLITSVLKNAAQNTPPPHDPNRCIYWLIDGATYFFEEKPPIVNNLTQYSFMPDSELRDKMLNMKSGNHVDLIRKNPHLIGLRVIQQRN